MIDDLETLAAAIDALPDAPDLETMTAADICIIAHYLNVLKIDLEQAVRKWQTNARHNLTGEPTP